MRRVYAAVRYEAVHDSGVHYERFIGSYRRPGWWKDRLIKKARSHLDDRFPFPRIAEVVGVKWIYQVEIRR